MVDDEIRRYAKVLEAVVKLSELSTRELERRLDLGGGTLNRIFTGKIDLKLRHVLLVLEVIPPFEQDDRQVLDDLKASVELWKAAINQRSTR